MKHLSLALFFLLTSFTLVAQESTFRRSYGRPAVFANEFVDGVQKVGDKVVVIGSRSSAATRSQDITFWLADPLTTVIGDSITIPAPGDQYVDFTLPGPDGGFLMVFHDFFLGTDLQLAYVSDEMEITWQHALPGFRNAGNLNAITFIDQDHLILSLAVTPAPTMLVHFTGAEGITDTLMEVTNAIRVYDIERLPGNRYLLAGRSANQQGWVSLIDESGTHLWEKNYPFTLAPEGEQPKRCNFYSSIHQIPGQNLVLCTGSRSDGRAFVLMDTLGNRLEEYRLENANQVTNTEQVEWYGESECFIRDTYEGLAYFVALADFRPTGNVFRYANAFGSNQNDGVCYDTAQRVLYGTANFSPQPGEDKGRLLRYDRTTAALTSTDFGTIGYNDVDIASALELATDGGYLIIGSQPDENEASSPVFIYVDSTGNILSRNFLTSFAPSAAPVLTKTADGNFLMSARSSITYLIGKVQPDGTSLWETSIPIGNTPADNHAHELPDGNLLCLNSTFEPETEIRFPTQLIAIDSTGAEQSRIVNNKIIFQSYPQLLVTPDAKIIFTGSSFLRDKARMTSANYGTGTENWTYETTVSGYRGVLLRTPFLHPNGNYAAFLYAESPAADTSAETALYYIEVNPDGQEVMRELIAEGPYVGPPAIELEADYFTVGFATGDAAPTGNFTINIVDFRYEDLEIIRHINLTSPLFTSVASIKHQADGRTAILANTSDDLFNNDFLLIVFDVDGNISSIRNTQPSIAQVTVSPNPTSGPIDLTFDTPLLKETRYQVFDQTGRLLQTGVLPISDRHQLDLSSYPTGSYFLLLKNSDGYTVKKVVKSY